MKGPVHRVKNIAQREFHRACFRIDMEHFALRKGASSEQQGRQDNVTNAYSHGVYAMDAATGKAVYDKSGKSYRLTT